MRALSIFYVYQKFRMLAWMQHENFPAASTRVFLFGLETSEKPKTQGKNFFRKNIELKIPKEDTLSSLNDLSEQKTADN